MHNELSAANRSDEVKHKLMRNIFVLCLLLPQLLPAQDISKTLNRDWQFYFPAQKQWFKATIPGTIHTDLLAHKLIPDPYFGDNEFKLQWIGETDWQYRKTFNIPQKLMAKAHLALVFKGLDTYSTVYLNGTLILAADNMFRQWMVDVKSIIKRRNNELQVNFRSAQQMVDSIAGSKLPLVLPDNPRVYARKAQYHFGWDWGPRFVTCGIWKDIRLEGWNENKQTPVHIKRSWNVKLIQQKDSIGTSFYFEQNGKPLYCRGANWIPAEMFLPRLTKNDYRKMLQQAKDANMNMLRVWGGGVYEDDYFYSLCDSFGIMVWQDFMFAGGMVPGDDHFFNNVKEEVKYQVSRLSNHPCIVLWCGNNEVDEAWHNWDWQRQFHLHDEDSSKVWNDYRRLFIDSLKKWVEEYDGTRPYISTSPGNGWGHKESLQEGDSHYWGIWWGLEDWEAFKTHTGRFVSEYGMQAMPNSNTINSFTVPGDRVLHSPAIAAHQKASDGFKKLDHYLTRYFIDSVKLGTITLENYAYLTQCLQYYILKNSIAVHRNKYPANMGTLLWQLNDCWPVISWSITDYSRQPKAAWYAVREAYREEVFPKEDLIDPKDLKLAKPTLKINLQENLISISTDVFTKYISLSFINRDVLFADNFFDLMAGETKIIKFTRKGKGKILLPDLKIKSLYDVIQK